MIQILILLRMRPSARVDHAARGVVAVLEKTRAHPILRYGYRQLRMPRMGLVQHRSEIAEFSIIPAKVTIIANGVGNTTTTTARCQCDALDNAANRWRYSHFAAIGNSRRTAGVLAVGKRIEASQQGAGLARAFDFLWRVVSFIADGPDGNRGMIEILPDKLG